MNAPGDASLNAADRLAIIDLFGAYAQDYDAGKPGESLSVFTGKKRWTRGHAAWVQDAQQRKQLHRLDDDILIAALSLAGGSSIEVATLDEHRAALPGLFGKRDRRGLRPPESAGFLQT